MPIVQTIDTLSQWAQENICNKIKLKVPPLNDTPNDVGYEYNLANPTAFGMYVPTSEKLPPSVHHPLPSLCVSFAKGQDDASENMRAINVQFTFSAWDAGLHTADDFKRNGEGWRDAWNFLDIALRAVESVTHIEGLIIDKSTPIEYGPLAEQDAIPNLYPFWFAWMSFRVTCPLRRNVEDFQNLL